MAGSQPVDDGLWELVKLLLPDRKPQRTGRPRVRDRAAFVAIVFVLVAGLPWRLVPRQIGCSGMTAWRRLREWQRAGVWERLHREVLRRLRFCNIGRCPERVSADCGSWGGETKRRPGEEPGLLTTM